MLFLLFTVVEVAKRSMRIQIRLGDMELIEIPSVIEVNLTNAKITKGK